MVKISEGLPVITGNTNKDIQSLADNLYDLRENLQHILTNLDKSNFSAESNGIGINSKVGGDNYTEITQDQDVISLIAANTESIASLSIRADGIDSTVTGLNNDYSTFKQTVDGWTFAIDDGHGHRSTGSIKNGTIDLRDFELEANKITSGTINAIDINGSTISGGTVTGSTISGSTLIARGEYSGVRISPNSSNGLEILNGSGVTVATLASNTYGDAYLSSRNGADLAIYGDNTLDIHSANALHIYSDTGGVAIASQESGQRILYILGRRCQWNSSGYLVSV